MNWGIFFIVLSGVFGTLTISLVIYISWQLLRQHWPVAAQTAGQLLPWIAFWAFWGAVFGLLGVALLVKFVGISPRHVKAWLVGGTLVSALWGVLWGIVYGLTERQ